MANALVVSAQNGRATTQKKAFSRETEVSIDIQSNPEIIWALLTNGSDYTRWNSTITSFEGDIEKGEKIKLKSTLDPRRTFKLKVKSMLPEQEMTWASGAAPFFKGKRTYQLKLNSDGTTTVTMKEKIGGLMFPMAARSIPSFDKNFEKFVSDLKKEAEIIYKTNN